MPTVADVIKHLEGYDKDSHIAAHIWCEEDVIAKAKERGRYITTEQTQEILDRLDSHIDCELGITWVTIDCALDDLALPELYGESMNCLICGAELEITGVGDDRVEWYESLVCARNVEESISTIYRVSLNLQW